MASFQAKDLPSKMRRRLRLKPLGNRRESRETSHIFMAAPIGHTTSTLPQVSASLKIVCPILKVVLSDFLSFPWHSCDSSEHVFRPRLPATPSGHAFRRATRKAERLSQASSVFGSTPNDFAHAERRFLDSVQMIARLPPLPSFRTAVSFCVVLSGITLSGL